nr:acetyl-CoA carboxyltransferase beta subunit [Solanum aridum]YP_010340721.1 acetyl-CoA carboxyltransferase beta subunit [Solanum mortonii]YP_010340804.1 acetyl-CoA carboxyltransferase beta subunit [Solanum multispinum]YP_010340887.1 acetyl-CoA carboxyltransferase beta subunit [Solanum nemorense]YP_010344411.1 acetyl-CoA carboxyltransferase beta subunit [Solanum rubicaule]YP_010345867.1 acetyl-CoA carboxyltransferase beta subunit [Solanum crotonoides]YP_010346189.1 acetyl-CoA carboxyltransfe
MTIHLLYFHAN